MTSMTSSRERGQTPTSSVLASITVGERSLSKSSRRFYYQSVSERTDASLFLAQSIKSLRQSASVASTRASTRTGSRSARHNHPLFQSAHLQQLELAYLQTENESYEQDPDTLKEIDEYYDFDSTGQLEASEFLDNKDNVQLLQQDLAAAERLFFQQHPLIEEEHENEEKTSFPITPLDISKYNNVEHKWHQKPFCIQHMMVFFGMLPHDRMERIIHTTLQQIQQHAPKCWNGADIPMANVGRLFGAKLYVPIQNEDQWPIPKKDNTSGDDISSQSSPSLHKLEYLSGVWLSIVYMGNADQHFFQWIDDAQLYVKNNYGLQVHPHDGHSHWFVSYPNPQSHARPLVQSNDPDSSIVIFFIKVSDVLTI